MNESGFDKLHGNTLRRAETGAVAIRGAVQAVDFRPFVYGLAKQLFLALY